MDIKSLLSQKTFIKDDEKVKISSWQEYAISVCKDFNVDKAYQQIIFRQAKRNIEFLKGKVENCKEKFGEKGINNKGRYLIALFRKKKPWEN